MNDIKILECCPKCGHNLTLMDSINMKTHETWIVKRCLNCGSFPTEEIARTAPRTEATGGEWIPVSERLPDKDVSVLVTGHEYNDPNNPRFQTVSRFNGDEFEEWVPANGDEFEEWVPANIEEGGYWGASVYVTHWQPLPPPPVRNAREVKA